MNPGDPIRVLTWNLFHGRDFPPDPALFTKRSKLLRITERNAAHAQVNRNLLDEFVAVIASIEWDIALFQEFPPRWHPEVAERLGAESQLVLTSRNSLAPLRRLAALVNPDLLGSNDGGSNVTLVRGRITERREIVVAPGPKPERRALALTRCANGLCVANGHLSAGAALRAHAEAELRQASETSLEWAGDSPLILGGDLNLRPRQTRVFDDVASRYGLAGTTDDNSIDHLLVHGLDTIEHPAALPPEAREVAWGGDVRVRLSDHSPVKAVFAAPAG